MTANGRKKNLRGMFDSPAYDDCRAWIQKKNSKGISWENIRLACKSDLESLDKFLKIEQEDDDWPRMSIKEWISLVDEMILIDFCKKQQGCAVSARPCFIKH